MIGFLRGKVLFREGDSIILDVNGVGYKVRVASDVLVKGALGMPLELFIYTHVREDIIALFGFLESLDIKLFENLIGVSGIGPKLALSIFSLENSPALINLLAVIVAGLNSDCPIKGTPLKNTL